MHRNPDVPNGIVETLTVESRALHGNPLGDPHTRRCDVYLPANVDPRGLPLLIDLAGFFSSALKHTGWSGLTENLPERFDRLISTHVMPPCVIAFPDCFTKLGGNQFIDSPGVGRYASFLIEDILPAIENKWGCGGPGKRGLFGRSSGGFGAVWHGCMHADVWSAVSCHSGDMGFEWCYLTDMPNVLNTLAKYDRSIPAFLEAMPTKEKPTGREMHALMMLAMAATYDPDPKWPTSIRLPVDIETCELIDARWDRWLAFDPARIAADHIDALKSLKALYIDCGSRDQYHMHYGARRLVRTLTANDVPHVYEEFDDDHNSLDYRYDVSLPILVKALTDGKTDS
ncbi:MAG: alpha/beta hydrolase-fold protein [Pseudomonadota bacterium]|nr:alpha/beta hydrolase-fold protein [Pseudomonadota bacterium]